MAIKAIWIPNTSYLPADDRLGLGALLAPGGTDQTSFLSVRPGVIPAPAASTDGPLRVVPGGARTVNVNIGQIVISAGATKGAYIVSNDSSLNIALPTAHATLARIDVVYVLVSDTSNGGGSDSVTIAAVTGTAASSPVAPSIPAGAVEIGRVNVTAGLTTVLTGNIVDTRVFTGTAGQTLPVLSTAKPTYGNLGQRLWLTDTNVEQVWGGSSWVNTGITSTGGTTGPIWASGVFASRPVSGSPGDRYFDTTNNIEWSWINVGGTFRWTPAAGGIVLRVNSTGQSITSGSKQQFTSFAAPALDILGSFASNTFTPTIPGYYECTFWLLWPAATAGERSVQAKFNGSEIQNDERYVGLATFTAGQAVVTHRRFNGTTDALTHFVYHNAGSAITTADGYLTVKFLGG